MIAPAEPPSAPPSPAPDRPAGVLAGSGGAMAAWAAATVAVQVGTYGVALAGGAPQIPATLAALAVAVLWVAAAAPLAAAATDDTLAALLRGGSVVDASVVLLTVVWAASPAVTLGAAAKTYCVLLAAGLAGIAACRVGRTGSGRLVLAVAAGVVLLALAASPFWIGGAIHGVRGEAAGDIVAAAVYANPFYSITAALAEETGFVWHEAGVMYRITRIGDYSPAPPACWYAAAGIHACVAAGLAGLGLARHRRRRGR